MTLLTIILIFVIYFLFLLKNNLKNLNLKIIIISIFLITISSFYFFNSSSFKNLEEYKNLYSKNLVIRDNIKIIKENIPNLVSKLNSNPNDFNGWLMLGKSYSILQKYTMASRAYQIALNLNPNNLDVIKEYILVLRSDSEKDNKELITKYYKIYLSKNNDALMLIDRLNFSVSVNDNALAIETLEKLIVHKDIENKNEYKSALAELRQINNTDSFLSLRINSSKKYNGFLFILLKELDINRPFAVKRINANKKKFDVIFSEKDFMLEDTKSIPEQYEIVIKFSEKISFSMDNKPKELYSRTLSRSEISDGEIIEINL